MRALWVTAEPPDRDLGGGSIREAYLLEALAGRVETHLLLAGRLHDRRTRAAVAGVVEIDAEPREPPAGVSARRMFDLWRACGREPAESFQNRPVRRALAAAAAAAPRADIVVVEHAALARLLPARRSARWALTLHNVASVTAEHAVPLQRGARQRWLMERERRQAARLEAWAVGAYDVVFTVSDDDAAALTGPSVVIPNGVDTARFRPTPLPAAPTVVFTATLNYFPNVDGVRWLCHDVWPLVRREVATARLAIVGRHPVGEVEVLAGRDGVELHADVASVVPYLEAARLAVVPLRLGSGTRLKALEAMAAGRPVVGTTLGLAGLGIEPGRHAMVADDAPGLARRIVDLLVDDDLARRLQAEGRALAEERYDWRRVGGAFVDALLSGRRVAGTAG